MLQIPYTSLVAEHKEVEIKFRIPDLASLEARLFELNFHQETPPSHEMNILYDRAGELRRSGSLLRLRKYADTWLLTYKGRSDENGTHKTRIEIQTKVADGEQMNAILLALGYSPSFRYEKFRSEWTDGEGNVVLDQTPIGNFGEIEGSPDWIDRIADELHLPREHYITKSYAELFFDWQKQTHNEAAEMTFAAIPRL